MNIIDEIMDRAVTQVNLAKVCHTNKYVVHGWLKRGSIPAEYWHPIVEKWGAPFTIERLYYAFHPDHREAA